MLDLFEVGSVFSWSWLRAYLVGLVVDLVGVGV